MSDKMTFPETWEEFEKSYGFTDSEEIYTNGSRLIPYFRVKEILENLPSASTDLSTFSDKLWKIAYERGKAEGQTEAWEFAIDAYYGTTKEQELFECLTFTQAKTEREELGKCEEKNNAGQIFVELANHINRCINDSVKKMREGEEE